jgi:hypothetical protein
MGRGYDGGPRDLSTPEISTSRPPRREKTFPIQTWDGGCSWLGLISATRKAGEHGTAECSSRRAKAGYGQTAMTCCGRIRRTHQAPSKSGPVFLEKWRPAERTGVRKETSAVIGWAAFERRVRPLVSSRSRTVRLRACSSSYAKSRGSAIETLASTGNAIAAPTGLRPEAPGVRACGSARGVEAIGRWSAFAFRGGDRLARRRGEAGASACDGRERVVEGRVERRGGEFLG